MLHLRSSHLYFPKDLVKQVFDQEENVFLSFQEEHKTLLIAPATATWFPKMHPAKQGFLKMRNLQGDKTLALHDILLDYGLNGQNRDLEYEWKERTRVLRIQL